MLFKEVGKKVAIVGISFGLIASPLAMAQPSIELNQDRSVGSDVIDKPQSHWPSNDAQASPGDLNRDEGDSLDFSPSSSAADNGEQASKRAKEGYSTRDLNRDEGDSTDW